MNHKAVLIHLMTRNNKPCLKSRFVCGVLPSQVYSGWTVWTQTHNPPADTPVEQSIKTLDWAESNITLQGVSPQLLSTEAPQPPDRPWTWLPLPACCCCSYRRHCRFDEIFWLWKFVLRGWVATMMTLMEINCAHGMTHLFCAADAGLVHSSPYASCTASMYSCLPPLPHPITLYVLIISHSPGAEQAPPLATAARLDALSQVIWGNWATQRKWRDAAEGTDTIEAIQIITIL